MALATQASIDQLINTTLPTDFPGGIAAASLRSTLQGMNAAIFQSTPPSNAPTAGTVLNATSPILSSWTSQIALGLNGVVGGSITLYGSSSGNASIAPSASAGSVVLSQGTFGNILSINGPNASIANYLSMTATVSGSAPSLAVVGTDTSISINLAAQGNGGFNFSNSTGSISLLTPIAGVLAISGYLATNDGGFQTVHGTTAAISSGLVLVVSGSATALTLPLAAAIGQEINIKMAASVQTVTSASSNIVPLNSTTAGTAIFSSGNLTKFAKLIWDGANWQMMQAA